MKFASSQPSVTVSKKKVPFATMSHACKGYFPLCKANFMGFSHKYGILDTTFWKLSQKMQILLKQFHEINLFANISHGCKGENIIQNHDSWLQNRHNLTILSSLLYNNLYRESNLLMKQLPLSFPFSLRLPSGLSIKLL